MTRKEVAEYLNRPVGVLERWAWKKTGPRYIRVGRETRYRQSDVDAWLEAQTVETGQGGKP